MQNLTGRYPAALCPTSQSGGNVVFGSQNKLAMTAPGSDPVDPLPEPVDLGSGLPRPSPSGPPISVSSPRPQPRIGAGDRGGDWVETPDPEDQPKPSPEWKQL